MPLVMNPQEFDKYLRADVQKWAKLIKTANRNLAASRNVGLPHCTGDIIAMTDDDAKVFPDWVTAMKRAHRAHPEAGAVGGPVLGTNPDRLAGKKFTKFAEYGHSSVTAGRMRLLDDDLHARAVALLEAASAEA